MVYFSGTKCRIYLKPSRRFKWLVQQSYSWSRSLSLAIDALYYIHQSKNGAITYKLNNLISKDNWSCSFPIKTVKMMKAKFPFLLYFWNIIVWWPWKNPYELQITAVRRISILLPWLKVNCLQPFTFTSFSLSNTLRLPVNKSGATLSKTYLLWTEKGNARATKSRCNSVVTFTEEENKQWT